MGTDESNGGPQAKRRAILDGLTSDELQVHIDQLYTSEVTSALRDIVHAYEIEMGVAVSRVSVRSMKTRWGSCTPKTGAIRIARELATYPVECLDMVVAHELVHLLEPSHNQRSTPCSTRTAPTIEPCRSGSKNRPPTSSSVG